MQRSMLGPFAHLKLSQLTLSLHVLEARGLDTQLRLHTIQLLLRSCQLLSAGGQTATQAVQLIGLVCDSPLKAVMLAASSVKKALELPHIVLTGSIGFYHKSTLQSVCKLRETRAEMLCPLRPAAKLRDTGTGNNTLCYTWAMGVGTMLLQMCLVQERLYNTA